MKTPDMTILYVRNTAASTQFYRKLFDREPAFDTPYFVSFVLDDGHQLALWSGPDEHTPLPVAATQTATTELCITLDEGPSAIEAVYREFLEKGIEILEPSHDAVFGRTFVAADPDGNRLTRSAESLRVSLC